MRISRRSVLAGLGLSLVPGCRGAAPAEGVRKEREAYGDLREQVGDWWVPPGDGRVPTVVLVHGGYWQPGYDLTLEDRVAADLSERGFLVWNVDYRSAAAPYPATLDDVAAAYAHLRRGRYAERVGDVAVVGHSAGGHLALWLAATQTPKPVLCVPQAPVAALARAAREGLGAGAAVDLVDGTPQEVPDRYAAADPTALAPTGVRTVLLHGDGDGVVPVSQSETYLAAAGEECTLVRVPGGHFAHLDPRTPAVEELRRALNDLR